MVFIFKRTSVLGKPLPTIFSSFLSLIVRESLSFFKTKLRLSLIFNDTESTLISLIKGGFFSISSGLGLLNMNPPCPKVYEPIRVRINSL